MEDKEAFSYPPVRKFLEQDESDPNFYNHKRHIFVFTRVGKPVYSRYGNEEKMTSFIATLNTIMEKLSLPRNKGDKPSVMRTIENEDTITVFLYRGEFCYVCVTQDKRDPIPFLLNMLEAVNIQIISIITDGVNKQLERRPGYDVRNMLGGTDSHIGLSIKNSTRSPSSFLNAFMPHPLNGSFRSQIHSILKEHKHPKSLYTILISPITVLSIAKQKGTEIHPQDILLLFNLVNSSTSLKKTENWVPLCLPGVSPEGYLYAYVYFYTKYIGIVMITAETTSETFFEYSKISKEIQKDLIDNKLIESITNKLFTLPYSEEIIGVKSLKHFLVKSISQNQFTMPKYLPLAERDKDIKKIIKTYSVLYHRYLEDYQPKKKDFQYFELNNDGHFACFATTEHIAFVCMNPLESLTSVSNTANKILKWIKEEENNNSYFIVKM